MTAPLQTIGDTHQEVRNDGGTPVHRSDGGYALRPAQDQAAVYWFGYGGTPDFGLCQLAARLLPIVTELNMQMFTSKARSTARANARSTRSP